MHLSTEREEGKARRKEKHEKISQEEDRKRQEKREIKRKERKIPKPNMTKRET